MYTPIIESTPYAKKIYIYNLYASPMEKYNLYNTVKPVYKGH
jgi:hypothetical protein